MKFNRTYTNLTSTPSSVDQTMVNLVKILTSDVINGSDSLDEKDAVGVCILDED